MDDAEADVLAYMSFPAAHRAKLHPALPDRKCSRALGVFASQRTWRAGRTIKPFRTAWPTASAATVGDLCRMRKRTCNRFAIPAAAVTRDNGDVRVTGKPRLRGRLFSVWQPDHWPAPFEVADDCSVSVIATPRPVGDTDHVQRLVRDVSPAAYNTQQRIAADRHHQPTREARGRSPAHREAKVMHDMVQPARAASGSRENIVRKPLRENLPPTQHGATAKSPCLDGQANPSSAERQAHRRSPISAVDPAQSGPARRTYGGRALIYRTSSVSTSGSIRTS
jgi:hypothetical protein